MKIDLVVSTHLIDWIRALHDELQPEGIHPEGEEANERAADGDGDTLIINLM